MGVTRHSFIKSQIEAYSKVLPRYEKFCDIMKQILKHIVSGCSSGFILEGHTKSISEFAKLIDKIELDYSQALDTFSDFTQVLVILPKIEELEKVRNLIREYFQIIVEDEEQKISELEPQEYWYVSNKFTIQLNPNSQLYERLQIEIPEDIFKLKAKIQLRTFLQHGWAVNQHESFHKTDFKIPKQYLRELYRIVALLEIADNSLNNLMKKMTDYESSYGAYMSNELIQKEIERLEIVYEADKTDFEIAHKIAKLAMAIDDWDKAIRIIENVLKVDDWKKDPDLKQAAILRDLGISLCKKYKNTPQSERFLAGQSHLQAAIKKNPQDSDALSSLGGSYKILKDYIEAYNYYKKALEVSPGDPYPLVNFLIMKIKKSGDLSQIKRSDEMIQKGIERRLNHIEVKVDFPWAYFDLGTFSLFLGNIDDAIYYYLNGIKYSPQMWMIDTTLDTLDDIKDVHDEIEGIEIIRLLLLLGMALHPHTNKAIYDKAMKKLGERIEAKQTFEDEHTVIIAGGTDEQFEKSISDYQENFIKAFNGFSGSIISGGTRSGVSAIAGDIQKEYPDSVKTIGYIPTMVPYDVKVDKRYGAIHSTSGRDFSVMEVFQYWYDILVSGVDPSSVKLIGINGGKISAIEFRIAIVFGAQVGIIGESGRAASVLTEDEDYIEYDEDEDRKKPRRLFKILKNTSEDIHDFLTQPFTTDPDIQNLRKFLVQISSGHSPYEKDFSLISQPGDLMSGLLSAIQSFAAEIGFGAVPALSAEGGSIIMSPFKSGEYRLLFFLFEKPSKSLAKKIKSITKIMEAELKEDLDKLHSVRMYDDHTKVAEIFGRVFGPEIMKFFHLE